MAGDPRLWNSGSPQGTSGCPMTPALLKSYSSPAPVPTPTSIYATARVTVCRSAPPSQGLPRVSSTAQRRTSHRPTETSMLDVVNNSIPNVIPPWPRASYLGRCHVIGQWPLPEDSGGHASLPWFLSCPSKPGSCIHRATRTNQVFAARRVRHLSQQKPANFRLRSSVF